MKIVKFQSEQPLTEFAPYWEWVMCEDESFVDPSFFEKIASIILEKEKQIIQDNTEAYNEHNKKFDIVFDGATGLGEYSLTSRSPFFNVFTWNEPEIAALNQFIHAKYIEFLKVLNVTRRKVWIQCWANVMREGEEIKQHIHASHALTWLGGHITVKTTNTSTFYVNPMMRAEGKQVYESKNVAGKLTIFQNNIPHYTNKHEGKEERISIAFDLVVDERYNEYSDERKSNFILFDTP